MRRTPAGFLPGGSPRPPRPGTGALCRIQSTTLVHGFLVVILRVFLIGGSRNWVKFVRSINKGPIGNRLVLSGKLYLGINLGIYKYTSKQLLRELNTFGTRVYVHKEVPEIMPAQQFDMNPPGCTSRSRHSDLTPGAVDSRPRNRPPIEGAGPSPIAPPFKQQRARCQAY